MGQVIRLNIINKKHEVFFHGGVSGIVHFISIDKIFFY